MIRGFYRLIIMLMFISSQLKYLSKDSVATLLKSFLYSNKAVCLDAYVDRRPNNTDNINKRRDPNFT